MRKKVAGTLALIVAIAGLPLGRGALGRSQRVDAASAPGPVAAGAPRGGTVITRVISAAVTVEVPGYKDIFLAGQDYPFFVQGRFGIDPGGRSSPVRLSVQAPAGRAITIATKYAVAAGDAAPLAPDANGLIRSVILAGPAERGASRVGLSSIKAPVDGLVGVFTAQVARSGKVPPTLDFGTAKLRDQATLRPKLYQVFYLGRGITGAGKVKQFIIPAGARYLYIAPLDAIGASHDNHGTILATVTGLRIVIQQITVGAPTPTATATPKPRKSPTPRPTRPRPSATPRPTQGSPIVIGQFLPTATISPTPIASNTRTVTPTPSATPTLTSTPVLPPGFSINAFGQIVNALGQVVTLNAQGQVVNAQGQVVNAQGQVVNAQGTPVNVLGTPIVSGGGGAATSTPPGGSTNTPIGGATNTPVLGTNTPGPTNTPFGQPIGEAWEQYQFDESHGGYQAQDTGRNNNVLLPLPTTTGLLNNANDPVADPASAFYAGNLKLNWASPQLNGNAVVNGGPVLGLQGLYYTAGDGSLRCVFANAVPDLGSVSNNVQNFRCPSGISAWTATTNSGTSLAANAEDDPPAVITTQNTLYFLSHNNPNPGLANVPGPLNTPGTGSLTAYNASTGARLNYLGNVPLYTNPFTALSVHVNTRPGGTTTCYVPTINPVYSFNGPPVPPANRYVLHYLNCGAIGDGSDKLYIPVAFSSPTPTAPPTPLIGPPTPNPAPGSPNSQGGGIPDASQLQGVPTTGAVVDTADNLVMVCEQLPNGSGLIEAFNNADASPSTVAGTLKWSQPLPAVTTFQPIVISAGAGVGGGEVVVSTPGGVRAYSAATGTPLWLSAATTVVTAGATDAPAYNPDTGFVYVGLVGVTPGLFYLAALNAGTGAVAGVSPADGVAITGAPVTDTGVGGNTTVANARSVAFYVDANGTVNAVNAVPSGTAATAGTLGNIPLANVNGIPNVARPGASLIVANGHLYFGNTNGRIYDFSF